MASGQPPIPIHLLKDRHTDSPLQNKPCPSQLSRKSAVTPGADPPSLALVVAFFYILTSEGLMFALVPLDAASLPLPVILSRVFSSVYPITAKLAAGDMSGTRIRRGSILQYSVQTRISRVTSNVNSCSYLHCVCLFPTLHTT